MDDEPLEVDQFEEFEPLNFVKLSEKERENQINEESKWYNDWCDQTWDDVVAPGSFREDLIQQFKLADESRQM